MYTFLLSIHALLKWFVLYGLLASFILSGQGLLSKRSFGNIDEWLRRLVTYIGQGQVGIGVILYFVSPVTRYFLSAPGEHMGHREMRYFAIEHPLIMILGISCCVFGNRRARKKTLNKDKFKTILLWYLIAFLIFSIAIPWPDSTIFPNRPLFRSF